MTAAVTWLWRFLALLAFFTVASAQDGRPLKGVALVIGTQAYEHLTPLGNPERDARAVEAMLDKLGFETTGAIDRNAKQLARAIEGFIEDAEGADVALVYYSGHGVEAGGENYLIPVDAKLDATDKGLVPLSPILEQLTDKAKIAIVLLDACRNSPFPPGALLKTEAAPQGLPIGQGGLIAAKSMTPVKADTAEGESLGQVIGFAAEPGHVALDGEQGGHSPYAAALLKHLPAKGAEFGDVMTLVREEVYVATGALQVPWTNTSLRRLLAFGGAAEEDTGDDAAIRGERRKLLLTIAATPQDLRRTVETLAQTDKLPLAQLYGMLKELQVDTSGGPEAIDKQLKAGAENLKEIMAARVPVVREDEEVAKYVALADRAQAEGAIKLALDFRAKASARVERFVKSLDERQAEIDTGRKQAAATFAEEAETAVLAFDYARAAKRYGAAFGQVAAIDQDLAWRYKLGEADALKNHGLHKGANDALAQAIEAYGAATQLKPRATHAREWGVAQNNLGNALWTLGDRQSGTATLEKAVAAFEAALEERTLERAPLDWATTKTNLGNALSALGERESGTATLNKAVTAFEAALGEFTRERAPLQWAATQSSLGIALWNIGKRESGKATLERAVVAYEAVLEVFVRERLPLDWAKTQNNLGNALRSLGARESGTATLKRAVAAYEASLEVLVRDRVPLVWATVQSSLGNTLRTLGERESGSATLVKAVAALEAALGEFTRERAPLQWAIIQNNLGLALWRLGELESGTATLEKAAAAFEAALKERTRERVPLDWAVTQGNLGNVLQTLAGRESGTATLKRAVAAYEAVLEELTRERTPLDWAATQNNLGIALRALGERETGTEALARAVSAYEAALEIRTRERVPLDWATTQNNLGWTLGVLGERTHDAASVRRGRAAVAAAWDVFKEAGYNQEEDYFAKRLSALDAMLAKLGQN